MQALLALVGAGIAKLLTSGVAKFIALKLLLYSLFTLILPVILYNVFTKILEEYMDYISDKISSEGLSGHMIELTGFGGWIATEIQLPLCLSMFLSAIMLRFVLNMIRI